MEDVDGDRRTIPHLERLAEVIGRRQRSGLGVVERVDDATGYR
jgi:hypothetical protein